MSDVIDREQNPFRLPHVWTRAELEALVEADQPEGSLPLSMAMSPRLILTLIDFASQRDGRVEMVSLAGDPRNVTLRFYRRDVAVREEV